MLVSDFDYHLPKELIAQKPIHPRDCSRLLVLNRRTGAIKHRYFYDLSQFLKRGDLLVFNNTKVFRARLFGHLSSRAERSDLKIASAKGLAMTKTVVEIFLLRPIDKSPHLHCGALNHKGRIVCPSIHSRVKNAGHSGRCGDKYSWEVLAKPGKKLKEGGVISFGHGLNCRVQKKKGGGVVIVKFNQPKDKVVAVADKIGHVPVPPYIGREPKKLSDYQTIYAKNTGSVAAPTAGFHFTPRIFRELKKRGVNTAFITLHVGLGTFQPVKTERVEEHEMHSEWVEIDKETVELIKQAKKAGQRVIAVGTTTARVLEGVAGLTPSTKTLKHLNTTLLNPYSGDINIFIYPGYKFKIIDGLITNFHLPKSTLLMLVSAFACPPKRRDGREKILRAYQTAVKKKYRFFSFGDAMLII